MARSKAQKKLGGPRIGGDGPRQAKADAVAEVLERVRSSSAVVLTEYRGMTVGELAELRAGLRQAGADYRVYKNTLARRATAELGLTELDEYLQGPTAFTFAQGDPVDAAKALAGFAKKVQTLVLKAGLLEGRVLSVDQVNELASLDSRDVMLAKVAGLFQAPLARAAALFAAGFQQMGSMLAQLRDKLPAEPAAEPEPAEPEPAAEPTADEAQPAETEPSAEQEETPTGAEGSDDAAREE